MQTSVPRFELLQVETIKEVINLRNRHDEEVRKVPCDCCSWVEEERRISLVCKVCRQAAEDARKRRKGRRPLPFKKVVQRAIFLTFAIAALIMAVVR